LRSIVLAAGILLVIALGLFLAIGKWKNPFNRRDIPKRLGIDIEQESNGVTYTQSHGGHTLFKLHASKVVQLKNSHALLHDVRIELYGTDGSRVDKISGDEFAYDQKTGTATAAGPVEITLMRPSVAPAIAPKAIPGKAAVPKPLASAAQAAAAGEIHVKTSGLIFDQKSGIATTTQRVDFTMAQGSGSSLGASYDSQNGFLILDKTVELTTQRGGDTVQIHAQHAEFERDSQVCRLHLATSDYRGGTAEATDAKVLFRDDGSAQRLEASNGFTATTATGSHLAAPTAQMDFDAHNQPHHGHLEGGVKMDTARAGRKMQGSAPAAELEFTAVGQLHHAHLERGVEFQSEEHSVAGKDAVRVSRTWRSPVADIDFHDNGHNQAEPAYLHGTGGVVVTGETQRGKQAPEPSRLSADEVTGQFGDDSQLTAITGTGNAAIEETTPTGTRQTSSGDRLEVHIAPAAASKGADASQIQSAVLDGHVILLQQPSAKPGAQPQAPMHATAGKAVYEGTGQWLHLTLNPRVEDGGLQLTADKVDVSQQSGDAFAHGNVKATWLDNGAPKGKQGTSQRSAPGQTSLALGGQGPAHVIASEAQLNRATGEATFRGHARLWQQANSVAGPVIVLDRQKQTLTSQSSDPAEPVRAVLLSAGGLEAPGATQKPKSASPTVIRLRGGDLWYSDAERKALMRGAALGTVVAETGAATAVSNEVQLNLLPLGNHASGQTQPSPGQAQVDKMTARGHVLLTSQDRRGTGEQLVYTSSTGEYVLTGTPSVPPRITDAARGSVTGEALIFHSRDDSVSIEGGGRKTTTDTTAPR